MMGVPAYDTFDCNGVCTQTGGEVTCELGSGAMGASNAPVATAVHDFAFTGDRVFSVYGDQDDGTDFCCVIDDESSQNVDGIVVNGSPQSDDIFFEDLFLYSVEMSDLDYWEAYGNDGNDSLHGADSNTLGQELLYGGAGLDDLRGEGGADYLYCGSGNDHAWGGSGDDRIYGELGDDVLEGEDGSDVLLGGLGADELYGDAGADYLCDTGSDYFEGNAGADKLYCASGAGSPTGLSDSGDSCGHTSHGSSWAGHACSYVLTTTPTPCL